MSIMVKLKVTEEMKAHLVYHTEKFFKEVVLNANLTASDVYVLFYLYKHREKKDTWTIYGCLRDEGLSYGFVDKCVKKLHILGLLKRTKLKSIHYPKGRYCYYVESELPRKYVRNVDQLTN